MKLTLEQRIELAEKRVERRKDALYRACVSWDKLDGPWEPVEQADRKLEIAQNRLHKLRKARERMTG